MSKAKRIRQGNRRAATVHGNNVRNGLTTCEFGGCSDCRTPEQQRVADDSLAIARARAEDHQMLPVPS